MVRFLWLGEVSRGMLKACHRLLHGDQCLLRGLSQLFCSWACWSLRLVPGLWVVVGWFFCVWTPFLLQILWSLLSWTVVHCLTGLSWGLRGWRRLSLASSVLAWWLSSKRTQPLGIWSIGWLWPVCTLCLGMVHGSGFHQFPKVSQAVSAFWLVLYAVCLLPSGSQSKCSRRSQCKSWCPETSTFGLFLLIPKCPCLWAIWIILSRSDSGGMILSVLRISPPVMYSFALRSKYGLRSGSVLVHLLVFMAAGSCVSSLSFAVSSLILSRTTACSDWTAAMTYDMLVLPGRVFQSVLEVVVGLFISGSSGSWSVANLNFGVPSRYIWSLVVVNSAAIASLLIWEYLFSVSVKVRLT